MILDSDETYETCADASSDVDPRHVTQDASPHNALTASELASRPAKSIGTSGPWYDVEEGRWIDEPVPRLGQQGVPSTPAQDQPQILPQSSTRLQDQINQQDIGDITQSTSVESAPHSLPKPSDNGDDGWTDLGLTSSTACLLLPHNPNPRLSAGSGNPRCFVSTKHRGSPSRLIQSVTKTLR
jgi:hypothetical protein